MSNDSSLRDEVEKLKALLQEQKNVASANNENMNKKLNELVDRDNTRFGQLNTVIDLLIKENQEMKNLIQSQRFIIQPINPYNFPPNGGAPSSAAGSTSGPSINAQLVGTNPPQNSINPFQDPSFLHNGGAPQPQQSPNNHHHHQHHQQGPPPAQSTPHQAAQHHHNQHAGQVGAGNTGANGHTPVLENSIGDHNNASGSIIRFINNQYVDDTEAQINAANNHPSHQNQRIDFVFMDPSSNKRNQYRVHSNSIGSSTNASGRHDDDSITSSTSDTQLTLPSNSSVPGASQSTSGAGGLNSRLQRVNNRVSAEFDAENYDLIIHNDFNKVEDVYYEYYNSLKPQVEKVSKAYKVKKIRKYQKIKALAVRIDRYRKLKGCSLEESFHYFENLRLGSDNRKKSVAWLYNSLPEVLKKVGLDDQLKKTASAQ